jgi:hypothetical protein
MRKLANKRERISGVKRSSLMARKTVLVSDLTGAEVEDGKGAQVLIKYQDARRGQVVLDVNADEVEDLARKGQRQARRGRRPKSESA